MQITSPKKWKKKKWKKQVHARQNAAGLHDTGRQKEIKWENKNSHADESITVA